MQSIQSLRAVLICGVLAACGEEDTKTVPPDGGAVAQDASALGGLDGALNPQPGKHRISGSVTASLATGIAMKLSGAATATVVPNAAGVYTFDNLSDGVYVITPSLFGYTFQPPSREVTLAGNDVIGRDFAAVIVDPSCTTGFSAGPTVSAGIVFSDLVSGDFNGDQKLDVVGMDSTVAVFLGAGDGTLQRLNGYEAGDGARYVNTADLNGDGKLDLLTSGTSATIFTLLGKGDGSFEAPLEHTVTNDGDGTKVALADFNADGKLDVAVGATGEQAVAVLLGRGDGTFADAAFFATGAVGRAVTAADFNRDGKVDLACTRTNPDGVSVLFGDGAGSFAAAVAYPVGKFPYSIVAGDFNADGALDLATCNNNGTNLSVLINAGAGTFASSVEYRGEGMPFTITSGDFNGDGKLDLASANGAVVGAGVYLGAGDGTFGTMTATRGPATGITSGDFDKDGKLDLAVAGGGGLAILRNCR